MCGKNSYATYKRIARFREYAHSLPFQTSAFFIESIALSEQSAETQNIVEKLAVGVSRASEGVRDGRCAWVVTFEGAEEGVVGEGCWER